MKKHLISILVLFVIFILLSCLIPVQATNLMETTSNELEQNLSSLEMFCLRKAYPYEYKALHYQEYFTGDTDKS